MDSHNLTRGLLPKHELVIETEKRISLIALPFIHVKNNPSIVLALLITLYAIQLSYNIFFHPLSKIPGPFLAKLNYFYVTARRMTGKWHEDTIDLHKKYGAVVRIGPNEVSFVDKEALKRVYGYGIGTSKSPWYSVWQSPLVSVNFFATSDVSLHRKLRGRVAQVYTMSSVLQMEPFIQDLLDKLFTKFRGFARKEQPFDMYLWILYFTYDAISELAMGTPLGDIDKGHDNFDLIASIASGFDVQARSGHLPGQLYWYNNSLTQLAVNKFGGVKAKGLINFMKFLSDRYDKRAKEGLGDRRRDMLQHFFDMKSITSEPVSKMETLSESVLVIGAGGDTTGWSIATILARFIESPEVVPKLQAEVDAAYKRLGLQKDEGISYNDAAKLPYLGAVIKEAMRLNPAPMYQLPRMAPEEGLKISGHFIPKGSHVGVNPIVMNRSTEVFGADAEQFRPERWLPTNEAEEEQAREASSLLTTFGMGARACVGKNIAVMETFKFIAQFVRQFEVHSAVKDNAWNIDSSFVARYKNFHCTVTERTE